jgi:hypothetical protein
MEKAHFPAPKMDEGPILRMRSAIEAGPRQLVTLWTASTMVERTSRSHASRCPAELVAIILNTRLIVLCTPQYRRRQSLQIRSSGSPKSTLSRFSSVLLVLNTIAAFVRNNPFGTSP